jgi:hypothetical protein
MNDTYVSEEICPISNMTEEELDKWIMDTFVETEED